MDRHRVFGSFQTFDAEPRKCLVISLRSDNSQKAEAYSGNPIRIGETYYRDIHDAWEIAYFAFHRFG